jgi:hypothetical protein
VREREGLIARIRHIRRIAVVAPAPAPRTAGDVVRTQALEARIKHLETLIEALQDSVHRESARQGRRIADLEAQIQPGALGIALSRDARERGL